MVAKYKSRRRTQRRIPPGGLKKKKKGGGLLEDVAEVAKSVMPVPAEQLDVHTSALHPEDIVKAVQHQPEIEHIGRELLEQHDNVKRYAKKVRFPRWMASKPDRSVDLTAMAKSIYKKHRHRHLPKLGGGVSAKQVFDVARTVGDPIKEVQKAKSQYDKIKKQTQYLLSPDKKNKIEEQLQKQNMLSQILKPSRLQTKKPGKGKGKPDT